eukprot:GHVP01055941.1.p1 GENE.GHVP01055941.1~~GHVP01055941.1.p1  ORF type:complete len:308 (+),score=77.79 GHVP01055941.1:423-1346(+)
MTNKNQQKLDDYLQLIDRYHVEKEELKDPTSNKLAEYIKRANEMHDAEDSTEILTLDAGFIRESSMFGKEQVHKLSEYGLKFSPEEFVDNLLQFMEDAIPISNERSGRGTFPGMEETEDKDEDSRQEVQLSRMSISHSRATYINILSPFTKKETRNLAAKPIIDPANTVQKENEKTDEIVEDKNLKTEKEDTAYNTKRLYSIIKQRSPIKLSTLITDPYSFSKTIERLFYFSFLLKQERVMLRWNEDGDEEDILKSIVYRTDSEQSGSCEKMENDNEISSTHMPFSMSYEIWEELSGRYKENNPSKN